eukprot:TRINITY_DN397_c0_g1_i2.p1 TRINITY_DN397_c0_g1~~TRINITY_DN397_c0_g1_i2.p1  ORF type:complete len:389 (-),score=196.52 TRINITY_DN397_c0_g1_i2:415-1581(-)
MEEEVGKKTVVQLKAELKKVGLPTNGRKAELVARLVEHLQSEEPGEEDKKESEEEEEEKEKLQEVEEVEETAEEEEEKEGEKREVKEVKEVEEIVEKETVEETQDQKMEEEKDEQDGEEERMEVEPANEEQSAPSPAEEKEEQHVEEESLSTKKRPREEEEEKLVEVEKVLPSAEDEEPTHVSKKKKLSGSVDEQDQREEVKDVASSENIGQEVSVEQKDEKDEKDEEDVGTKATSYLRIDNFVRPFSLMAAREFIEMDGKVKNLFLNRIRTYCVVEFQSAEIANRAFQRINGVRWPDEKWAKELACSFLPTFDFNADPRGRRFSQSRDWIGDGSEQKGSDEGDEDVRVEESGEKSAERNDDEPFNMLDERFRKTTYQPEIYWLPSQH